MLKTSASSVLLVRIISGSFVNDNVHNKFIAPCVSVKFQSILYKIAFWPLGGGGVLLFHPKPKPQSEDARHPNAYPTRSREADPRRQALPRRTPTRSRTIREAGPRRRTPRRRTPIRRRRANRLGSMTWHQKHWQPCKSCCVACGSNLCARVTGEGNWKLPS